MLRTEDVTRDFGGVHAVAGVTTEVRRGTLTGLIGPNGAGKSTLLAMLAGTMPVTSGQVIYAGADVTGMPAYRRARMGLVRTFQLASEFKRLTVMENLLSAVPVMDEFCDPVIVMAEGTVLASGTMAALRARTEVVEAYLVG